MMKDIMILLGLNIPFGSIGTLDESWKAIPTPKFNSYPINNKRGYAAKQKREAKKARRK